MVEKVNAIPDQLAPVALFVYNRLDHVRKVLEALKFNNLAQETTLYIFSDGPKPQTKLSDQLKVQEVRNYIKQLKGFKNVIIVERDHNWGLTNSIISGINEVLTNNNKIIVLESDTVPTKDFLTYMNDNLEIYESDNQVMHISGYMFPIESSDLPNTFFYNTASCWGWATYKRSWKLLINDPLHIWNELKRKNAFDEFNIGGYANFSKQLADNVYKTKMTWAIRWYGTIFLNNGFALHPSQSFIRNIGNDGTGTNSTKTNSFNSNLQSYYTKSSFTSICKNEKVYQRMEQFYFRSKPFKHNLVKLFKPILPQYILNAPFLSTIWHSLLNNFFVK